MFPCFKSVPVCKYLAIKLVCCVEVFSFIAVAKIDIIVIMSTLVAHCYKRNKTLSRTEGKSLIDHLRMFMKVK